MKNKLQKHEHSNDTVKCDYCSNFHDFDVPPNLVDEMLNGQVVLFAGAGISTETRNVLPFTFYDDVCKESGLENNLPFPVVMSRFCLQPNGRARLLRKIRGRFDYIRSFPRLYFEATLFHRELSTLFPIESIFTTNWDDYFESECGAIPFVTSEDFAFWSIPGRKVFKIHGSINNLGSIVATSEDYEKCYQRLQQGLLGSNLKMILATKTILYIGYSFRDEDFLRLHSLLRQEMGDLLPHAYIVTLDKLGDERFRDLGLTPIYTDATFFISVVKHHITADHCMLEDDRFRGVRAMLQKLIKEQARLHKDLSFEDNPEILHASYYQDGLLDSFQRILALKNTGFYSSVHNVVLKIGAYEDERKERLKARKYSDVSYIDGYLHGLYFLLADKNERKGFPLYYIFGVNDQPVTFRDFNKLRRVAGKTHKAAYKEAQRITKGLGSEFIPRHRPIL